MEHGAVQTLESIEHWTIMPSQQPPDLVIPGRDPWMTNGNV
jgi:hypothetical protein